MKKCCECENEFALEKLFLYKGQLYCAWCLIHQLAEDNIININFDTLFESCIVKEVK